MNKFCLVCGLVLSASLILGGCADTIRETESGAPSPRVSGDTYQPADTPSSDPTPSYKEVSVTCDDATLSIQIPEGWVCESLSEGSPDLTIAKYALHIYPEGSTEGFIEIGYVESFGVCGTGLEETETTLAGDIARVGVYDQQDYWSFIAFDGKNSGLVALNNSVENFSENKEQIWDILDTIMFDTGGQTDEICGYPTAENLEQKV